MKKDIFGNLKKGTILLSLTYILLSCNSGKMSEKPITITGNSIGTYYRILYFDEKNRDFTQDIEQKLAEIMNSCNIFDSNSTISKINRNEDSVLDDITKYVLTKSLDISERTHGYFDVTTGTLIEKWGFGKDKSNKSAMLSKEEVEEALTPVGYKLLHMAGYVLKKENIHTVINLGAIAKGYAVDVIAELLNKKGIESYLVEIGGEVYAKGTKPHDIEWVVGISVPDERNINNSTYQTKIKLQDAALATSGNYRNFYKVGEKLIGHTIHPKTGYPVQNELLSVSVIANDCLTADAFATAMMVAGLNESLSILSKETGMEAYFIYLDEEGMIKTYATENFQTRIIE